MTEALAGSPLAHAVGLALLQFLWQGAAIGAATAIVLMTLRRSSAQARYAVACAGLALMVATPIVTIASEMRDRASAQPVSASLLIVHATVPDPASGSNMAASAPATTSSLRVWLESQLPLVVLLYAAGVLMLALHLLGSWIRIGMIQRHANVLERDEWPDAVRRMADRLGITRRVRLIESALVNVPAVIGCLRPAIVMPVSALAGLPPAHLEAILAHELAHVRRGDYLINVIQCVVEVLLFYHPAVWWVSRQIRIEREHCCDDVAAALCPDRVSYAHALVSLEELRGPAPALAMAANGGDLLRRIRRLVEPGSTSGPTFSGRFAMCVALTVLLIAVSGHMQELPAVDDRPPVANVQPAADPVPTASAAVMAAPAPEARRVAVPAPRAPKPDPTPAPAPAREAEPQVAAPSPAPGRTTQSSIVGVVKDQSGGVIPGATVTVTSPTSSATHTTVTNAAGQFRVSAVPGEYDVTATLVGFKASRSRVQITADQTIDMPIRLNLGSLTEVVHVATEVAPPATTAPVSKSPTKAPGDLKTTNDYFDAASQLYQQRQFAEAEGMMTRGLALLRATPDTFDTPAATTVTQSDAASAAPIGPRPIRVGGDVREPRKIKDVKPVYPAEAAAAGVVGMVIIDAIVGKDGMVAGARVLRGNPMLDEAALNAVREWRFTPTLLNGVPVEVSLTVTVAFGSR